LSSSYNDPTFKELTSLSDRTAAIVAAAQVDDALSDFIRSRLLSDKDTTHKLFKPTGALGAFGTRADLAYLMGLINPEDRDDLYLIAEIRNRFAHWAKPASFADREISALCNKITILDRCPDDDQDPDELNWKLYKRPVKGLQARFWFTFACDTYTHLFPKLAIFRAEHR